MHTVIAPSAAEAAAGMLTDAREAREKIIKYLARLQEVRGKRLDIEEALKAAAEGGTLPPGAVPFMLVCVVT